MKNNTYKVTTYNFEAVKIIDNPIVTAYSSELIHKYSEGVINLCIDLWGKEIIIKPYTYDDRKLFFVYKEQPFTKEAKYLLGAVEVLKPFTNKIHVVWFKLNTEILDKVQTFVKSSYDEVQAKVSSCFGEFLTFTSEDYIVLDEVVLGRIYIE